MSHIFFKEILKKFSSLLFAHNTINSDYLVVDRVRDHIPGVVFDTFSNINLPKHNHLKHAFWVFWVFARNVASLSRRVLRSIKETISHFSYFKVKQSRS